MSKQSKASGGVRVSDDLREKIATAAHGARCDCKRSPVDRCGGPYLADYDTADAVLSVIREGHTVVPTPLLDELLASTLEVCRYLDETGGPWRGWLAESRRAVSDSQEGQAAMSDWGNGPCVCCDKPGPHPYEDRHGDVWCRWCHDNGYCTDKMGHKEESS